MTKIITSLVKELRDRTGLGVMDCKKALNESMGDIELAIEKIRKSGIIKSEKKADKITVEGIVISKIEDNYGIILEINCQTDFVAKNINFRSFANEVLNVAISKKITNVDLLRVQFEEKRSWLSTKVGENINIRRVFCLENAIGSYQHGTRIGVLVSARSEDKRLIKQIAMHIAANNPEFINPEDIPSKVIEKEYQVQLNIAMKTKKSKKILEKIVEGRMKKFINESSLTGQLFVMDPSKTVAQFLKEHNISITGFIRFQVGERIRKAVSSFTESGI